MGVDRDTFYDSSQIAILPMAFCFPGTGKSGDLPPPAKCAELWRARVLSTLEGIQLTIIIGKYARDWHFPEFSKKSLTASVQDWESSWPSQVVLPHPSPRNNIWLKKNPWFARDLLPILKAKVKSTLLDE